MVGDPGIRIRTYMKKASYLTHRAIRSFRLFIGFGDFDSGKSIMSIEIEELSRGGEHYFIVFPKLFSHLIFISFISFLFFSFLVFSNITTKDALASDPENCLFCHQYPLLGVTDNQSKYKSFFVKDSHYLSSVHSNIRCSECHSDVKKIPHNDMKDVNCMNKCHVIDPTSGRNYSHKKIEDIIKDSAHGIDYKYLNERGKPEDYPTCVSCHKEDKENKIVLSSRKGLEDIFVPEAKGKCLDCHSDLNGFVTKDLTHVLRRSERVYNQKEIMNMCISCHDNEELNERHKMVNAIYSYLENYHGRTMALGLDNAPSCIDCHVKLGDSPHAIKSVKDPSSSTNPANRGATCVRADCHPGASQGLGKSYIHVIATDREKFPIEFWVLFFFTILTVASFVSLMVILILELIRMIFPNFTLIKREGSDHDEH